MEHIECISDFCGNYKSPGAWADLWRMPDGTRMITLGGGWEYYAANAPERIHERDPLFIGFLQSCETGEDFGFAKQHWGQSDV